MYTQAILEGKVARALRFKSWIACLLTPIPKLFTVRTVVNPEIILSDGSQHIAEVFGSIYNYQS